MKRQKNTENRKNFTYYLKNIPTKTLILFLLTTFFIAIFFPRTRYTEYNYEINDITSEKIIAPFDFPVLKSKKELRKQRQKAKSNQPAVFKQAKNWNLSRHFSSFIDSLDKLNEYYYDLAKSSGSNKTDLTSKDSIKFQNRLDNFKQKFDLRSSNNNEILNLIYTRDPLQNLDLSVLRQILAGLKDENIANCSEDTVISDRIAIMESPQRNQEILLDKNNIIFSDSLSELIGAKIDDNFTDISKNTQGLYREILQTVIRPNLIYQPKITHRRQQRAIDSVPLSKGVVLENEKIVDANTKVTSEIYRKLESLNQARKKRIQSNSPLRRLPIIGDPIIFLSQLGLVLIIIIFMFLFFFLHNKDLFQNFKFALVIALSFLIEVILTNIFVAQFGLSEFSIPVTLVALMFTIIFDSITAFFGIITLCILLGLQLGGNIYFIITSLFVSSLAIYSVRSLRKRIQVIKSILFIGGGYIITISITSILQFTSLSGTGTHLLFGAINGLISPILTYGVIVSIEASLDITTDLGLLELADFNHPLLKKLSKEAPGTFSHSVTVGNLAEAAADAVGANALLTRVGAYYHDIGKSVKPEYFIENQSYDINKHDKIKPNLSALVIKNHVDEGLKLADKYNLPEVIKKFILTHHGTTQIEYFYKKALEISEDQEDINPSDFQYDGPKPDTKETAILMICESIEAATRSLDKPNISQLERMVDKIIQSRLEGGQLSKSPLTFADLNRMKGSIEDNTGLMPALKSVHHARVEYPEDEKEEEEQDQSKSEDISNKSSEEQNQGQNNKKKDS